MNRNLARFLNFLCVFSVVAIQVSCSHAAWQTEPASPSTVSPTPTNPTVETPTDESTKLPVPKVSEAEAFEAAEMAFKIIQSGDVRNPRIDEITTQLKLYRPYNGTDLHRKANAESRKAITESLVKSLDVLKTVQLDIEDVPSKDALQKIKAAAIENGKAIKENARVIAIEYLSIGDLADKLQLTRAEFQQIMGEKQALIEAIGALGKQVGAELVDGEIKNIRRIVDAVFTDAVAPSQNLATATTIGGPSPNIGDAPKEPIQLSKLLELHSAAKTIAEYESKVAENAVTIDTLAEMVKTIDFDYSKINSVLDAIPGLATTDEAPKRESKARSEETQRLHRTAVRIYFWEQYALKIDRRLQEHFTSGKEVVLPTDIPEPEAPTNQTNQKVKDSFIKSLNEALKSKESTEKQSEPTASVPPSVSPGESSDKK
jgi:hypothetical protein